MTLGQLIRLVLTTDAAVSALAEERVYAEVAPSNLLHPFIVYDVISDEPDVSMSGTRGPRRIAVEVTSWAAKREDARALGQAAFEVLRDYTGGAAGLSIDSVIAGPERWDFDSTTKLHMSTREYELWVDGVES